MSLAAFGGTEPERVLWMSLWVPGLEGRRGIPYVLVGDPGVTKTSKVRRLSRAGGMRFQALISSLRQPTDYLGLPRFATIRDGLGDDVQTTDHAVPQWAVGASYERTVLLFDELSTATQATQNALMRIVLDGMVGEYMLPATTRIVLATNEVDDTSGGWDVGIALGNRLGWLPWPAPTARDYTSWLSGNRELPDPGDPVALEAAVDAAWPEAWTWAVGQVAGFLEKRPELVHVKPSMAERENPAVARCWPSPRTWTYATHALAGCKVFGLSEAAKILAVAGFVGSAATTEFWQWLRHADLPDVQMLLNGQVQFTFDPARIDRSAAVLSAVSAWVTHPGCSDEHVKAAWQFLHDVPENTQDVALGAVTSMFQTRGLVSRGGKVAFNTLGKMEPLMKACGVGDRT